MKKAVVSGANGFIGSALVRELAAANVEVIALARTGNDGNIPLSPLVRMIAFEMEEAAHLPFLVKERDIDVFFHCAWSGSAGADRSDAAMQLCNVQWTLDCLRAAHAAGCPRFVCAGTIMERETLAAVFAQGNRPGSGYIYGAAKLAARAMCMPMAAALGIDLLWAEITNAYGPGETSPRFINSTLRRILRGDPLSFTSGLQTYDFVFIDDVARAFRLIGERGLPFRSYLIGSGGAKPLRKFVLEIQETVAPERKFIFGDVSFTGIDLPPDTFDTSLTEKDTGFRAETPFSEGVRRTMEWLSEREFVRNNNDA